MSCLRLSFSALSFLGMLRLILSTGFPELTVWNDGLKVVIDGKYGREGKCLKDQRIGVEEWKKLKETSG